MAGMQLSAKTSADGWEVVMSWESCHGLPGEGLICHWWSKGTHLKMATRTQAMYVRGMMNKAHLTIRFGVCRPALL